MVLFWWYVAAAVLTVVQSRMQARMQRQQGRIAGILGQTTLEGAIFEAELARKRGAEEAEAIRTGSFRDVGASVVQVASSGVELGGSTLLALGDIVLYGELDAAAAESNAQAAGFSAESRGRAASATGQAEGDRLRRQAGITETAGWLSAMSFAVKNYARNKQQTG